MVKEFQRTKVHFHNPTPSLENMNPIIFSILNNRSLRIPQSYYINFVSGTYQLRIPRLILFLFRIRRSYSISFVLFILKIKDTLTSLKFCQNALFSIKDATFILIATEVLIWLWYVWMDIYENGRDILNRKSFNRKMLDSDKILKWPWYP